MLPQRLVYASFLAAGLALPFASAASARVDISIDKTTQHMTVSVDGVTQYEFPVSTGRPGYDTPNGVFHPRWMSTLHYSKLYDDAPMPDSIFFAKGYAIHGFTDTPFGVAAVSHGCVRLPPSDAASLFSLVKEDGMANTTINIHGHIPGGRLVARRARRTQEAESEQETPIPDSFGSYGRRPDQGRAGYDDAWAGSPRRAPPVIYDDGYYGSGAYYQQPYAY